jgi:hypothetical protein
VAKSESDGGISLERLVAKSERDGRLGLEGWVEKFGGMGG